MNTRHFLHVFYTFDAAGAQVRAAALMRGLGSDYRHTVLAQDGGTGALELVGDTDVQLVDFKPAAGLMSGVRFFRQLLRQQKPDLMLSYNWGTIDAVMAARSLGMRRLVHHEDGFNIDEAEQLIARRNWTRRLVLNGVDVVVPSRQLQRIGQTQWHLQRLHYIANGIDPVSYQHNPHQGAEFRSSLGIPADAVVVGAVGHMRKVKNFGRLLRALALIDYPGIHLVLVGDGAEIGPLRSLADSLADSLAGRVHFTGHLLDLRPAYSAFDIFCLSSNSEQQPVSLLEAMAAGLPACSTDVGDVKATLPESQHPFIVPLGPTVETALADSLSRLARDQNLRQTLGAENRQHVEKHFSEIAMLGAYRKIYADAQTR